MNDLIKFNEIGTIIPDWQYALIVFGLIAAGIGTTTIFFNRLVKNEWDWFGKGLGGLILFLIVYFALAIAGIFIANGSNDPGISAIGFAVFMLPTAYACAKITTYHDKENIIEAAKATGITTLVMCLLGAAFPAFFLSLGKMLFFALLAVILFDVINSLILRNARPKAIAYIAAGIFALYLGYDMGKLLLQPHTANNAVDASLKVWIDLVNLFLQFLEIYAKN